MATQRAQISERWARYALCHPESSGQWIATKMRFGQLGMMPQLPPSKRSRHQRKLTARRTLIRGPNSSYSKVILDADELARRMAAEQPTAPEFVEVLSVLRTAAASVVEILRDLTMSGCRIMCRTVREMATPDSLAHTVKESMTMASK